MGRPLEAVCALPRELPPRYCTCCGEIVRASERLNTVDTKNPVWTSKSESAKKRASERTFAQKTLITFPYRGLYQGPENLPTLLVVPKGTESPKTVCRSHSNPFLQSKVPQTVFWVPKNGIFHKSLLRCGTSAVV